ncbi:MAG TPA: gluconate 2-dehydrogenase subunit 3 family protein [Stellaceae bacterium]|nr:gluconate 2-dehydrogenase subunit 3 family protein [Stellaceae bacterium]
MRRRDLLAGTALTLLLAASGQARTISGALPWAPDAADPPRVVKPGGWQFFTPEEGAALEALVDRIIPPDPQWPGAKDAGVAVFIDRQLAGPYGSARGLYMRPPFQDGTPQQGAQSPLTPAERYRQALAALDKYCRSAFAGKAFAALTDGQKDKVIDGLHKGPLRLEGASGTAFFEQLLKNTREGFFADPVYGGNRDMIGWKMIGFPGARYDQRNWVERHNERYPLPPVGITGRPDWAMR